MCPSYQVTREEEHSTRGRARLLFEMLDGHDDSRSRTAGARPRSATRSTCAWPARAARATARSDVDMATYKAEFLAPPLRAAGCARARTTRWAGCPLWARLAAARAAARSTRLDPRPPACSRLAQARSAASTQDRDVPALRRRDASPRGAQRRDRPASAGRARGDGAAVAGHLHQPPSTPASAGPPSRCSRTPAVEVRMPDRAAVLRPDLDLHRAARASPSGCCAGPSTRCAPTRAAGHAGRRPGAELHRGVPLRRRRAASRATTTSRRLPRADRAPSPSC